MTQTLDDYLRGGSVEDLKPGDLVRIRSNTSAAEKLACKGGWVSSIMDRTVGEFANIVENDNHTHREGCFKLKTSQGYFIYSHHLLELP